MFRTLAVAPMLGAAVVLSLVAGTCWAQPDRWPSKPIRYIVVFPPGGTTDIVGRILAEQLSKALGQPVAVENRPGAGGSVGSEFGAKQPPDGYTLIGGTISSFAINVSLYAKLGYDPVRDFQPITLVGSLPNVLVVHPSMPVKTVRDLIALAKQRPGELTFASAGSGTAQHLTGELFNMMAGVKMVHVPYKGGGPALADLMGGHVAMFFAGLPESIGFIRQGKLRAVAVSTATRSSQLPDIPTIAEAGLPGFDVTSWQGLAVPAGVPAPIVRRLNEEVVRILRTPEIREKFTALGIEVVGNSPDEFAAFMKAEIVRWAKIVKASGARAD